MGVHPVHAALTTPYVRTLLKIKSRQLARRPEFRGTDPADVSQDLIGQVLRQATRFDASRAGVNTFIAAVVESAAGMMCRDRRRLKRVAGLRLQSLEGSTLQHEGEEKALLDVLVDDDLQRRQGVYGVPDEERCDSSADMSGVLARLSAPLHKIASLVMSGRNEASIARDLHISRRRVRNAMAEIHQHFRRAGLE